MHFRKECEKAMASADAGIEIGLPPLIEDEEQRKRISRTVKNTRDRYRDFRSKLAQEIRQSKVLPEDIKNGMLTEIDKRLDVDVDELLASPKLKIQLSPAELDRQLLDLYNSVSENPGTDILRTVMGGANVGRQSYYIKNQALKAKARARIESREANSITPQFLEDDGVDENRSATKWIKRALRRNLQTPSNGQHFLSENKIDSKGNKHTTKTPHHNKKDSTTMLNAIQCRHPVKTVSSYNFPKRAFAAPHLSSRIPSLLI